MKDKKQSKSRSKSQNKSKQQNNVRKKKELTLLLILVVLISIGYATLSATLYINGTGKIVPETFSVVFDNISQNPTKGGLTEDTGTGLSKAAIIDDHHVTFDIKMRQPGDSYTFNVDVVNEGTLPAKTNIVLTPLDSTAANYLEWSVTGLAADEVIAAQGSKTLTVTVLYKTNASLPSSEVSASFDAEVTAVQS